MPLLTTLHHTASTSYAKPHHVIQPYRALPYHTTALYCSVLLCTALYYSVLCTAVLHCTPPVAYNATQDLNPEELDLLYERLATLSAHSQQRMSRPPSSDDLAAALAQSTVSN